jgi:hypothetical protein
MKGRFDWENDVGEKGVEMTTAEGLKVNAKMLADLQDVSPISSTAVMYTL